LARDISQSFYKYFIISKYFQEQLITYSKVSAQGGIYMGDVLKCAVITPPLPEQLSIAAYLDRETGRIDSLIDKKQRIVKLLKEQRIALISHAVTKGLDPNVKMKLSGVEWLGEVPEHWEIKRTRYKVLMNPSKREISGLPLETEVPFLPMEAVGDNGSLTLELTRPIAEVTTGYTFFSEGDVSFAKITPCFENGKGAIMQNLSTKFGFGTTELTVLRPGKTINNKYLYYLTISPEFRKNGEAWMYGAGGQKRVPDDFVREFIFSWPPLPEQRSIATYLDRETGRIDSLIEKVEKAIDILKEHRTALISAAVTGKIDVREAA
jgi:type I restriction enzyme S subunit